MRQSKVPTPDLANIRSSLTDDRLVPLGPPLSLKGTERKWLPAVGSEGDSISFTIRYRSEGKYYVAHHRCSSIYPIAAALVALGIKNNVDNEVPQPGTGKCSGCFPSSTGTRLMRRRNREFANYIYGDDDDPKENDRSGEKTFLAVCGQYHIGDPTTANEMIPVMGGEGGDFDHDCHNDLEEYVGPREETPAQNREATDPHWTNEESVGQQQLESDAHAEIMQRVREFAAEEVELAQVKAITAVKRKIEDKDLEDFPVTKRFLATLAEATDV
jgi:hypothetical protein